MAWSHWNTGDMAEMLHTQSTIALLDDLVYCEMCDVVEVGVGEKYCELCTQVIVDYLAERYQEQVKCEGGLY